MTVTKTTNAPNTTLTIEWTALTTKIDDIIDNLMIAVEGRGDYMWPDDGSGNPKAAASLSNAEKAIVLDKFVVLAVKNASKRAKQAVNDAAATQVTDAEMELDA